MVATWSTGAAGSTVAMTWSTGAAGSTVEVTSTDGSSRRDVSTGAAGSTVEVTSGCRSDTGAWIASDRLVTSGIKG